MPNVADLKYSVCAVSFKSVTIDANGRRK